MGGFLVYWFSVGSSKINNSFCLQFLLYIVFYFICTSIAGILFGVSSRQRVPMVPFIAILSAQGWIWIAATLKNKQIIHS